MEVVGDTKEAKAYCYKRRCVTYRSLDKGMNELGMMFLFLLRLWRKKKLRFARTVLRTVICLAKACCQAPVEQKTLSNGPMV